MHSFVELLMHVLWVQSAKYVLLIDGLIIPMNKYIPEIDEMRCCLLISIIINPEYAGDQKILCHVSRCVDNR